MPAPAAPPRLNLAPLVLVGGFTVWGRDEAWGLKYWGGPGQDLQEALTAAGFPTLTAAPGPFSSNWDRAAEVYAMLKGGRVDYGLAHSRRFGHARYGRTWPGLLPAWGGPDLPAVHLLGHSMGGQTIRVLAHLMDRGDEAERRATPDGELSPLFQGGQPGVLSLTTLATPHEGTTLTRKRVGLEAAARRLLALVNGLSAGTAVYDPKLDHWGLQREAGESLGGYRDRIMASPLWQGTGDFSAWDLSLEGARALNAWATLPAGIYAFSWSTAKTRPDPEGHQQPAPGMNFLWRPGARYMGRPQPPAAGQFPIDPSWFRNDGVVNTRSMAGPASDPVAPFDGLARKGQWNHMGILEGWDHSEILGMGPEHKDEVLPFFRNWAAILGSLI